MSDLRSQFFLKSLIFLNRKIAGFRKFVCDFSSPKPSSRCQKTMVSFLTERGPSMDDLKTKILSRVRGKGRGEVYVSKDFLDLGNRAAVDQALSRLVKAGELRRLGRGLFDFPRVNARLGGELSPEPSRVAEAVARKRGGRITPSGAHAANALGLSTQVPGKTVYVTNTSGGSVKVGRQTITF